MHNILSQPQKTLLSYSFARMTCLFSYLEQEDMHVACAATTDLDAISHISYKLWLIH